MSLKITTLIENMPDREEKLAFEHGFSVLVEAYGKKILFDTGQTGAFIKNARDLKVELTDLDMVVLSHGHYDHTGGVPELLNQLKEKTPFYIGKEFFSPKYKLLDDGSYKYNGNPFEKELLEEASPECTIAKVHYVEKSVTKVADRIYLFKNFDRVNNFETINPKFFIKTGETYEQDLFPDEVALGIETKEGLVLIVGCSHVGIVNILEHVKKNVNLPVAAVLGGTHLVEADEKRLKKTEEALKEYEVKRIAVSHCTGEAGMELLKKNFPDGFVLNMTGNVMEF